MKLDEGYLFGLGAFETIAVENGVPLFLKEHLSRMESALNFLRIKNRAAEKDVHKYLQEHQLANGVLKIVVSAENIVYTSRANPYTAENYAQGFALDFSEVRRNDTSPLTYYKTLNYGDCILEKRKCRDKGIDELIFLNHRQEICEGTTSNIFLVKNAQVYTPEIKSGLLPGIIRAFLLANKNITESVIKKDDLDNFDECFLTNSLLGIMPVRSLAAKVFRQRTVADLWRQEYRTRFKISP